MNKNTYTFYALTNKYDFTNVSENIAPLDFNAWTILEFSFFNKSIVQKTLYLWCKVKYDYLFSELYSTYTLRGKKTIFLQAYNGLRINNGRFTISREVFSIKVPWIIYIIWLLFICEHFLLIFFPIPLTVKVSKVISLLNYIKKTIAIIYRIFILSEELYVENHIIYFFKVSIFLPINKLIIIENTWWNYNNRKQFNK